MRQELHMAFSFKEERKFTITSVNAPENGKIPMETLLYNIFHKLERRPNAIKIMGYLILRERNNPGFIITQNDMTEFCNIASAPEKAMDDLKASEFIDWKGSEIIIRYENLLKP